VIYHGVFGTGLFQTIYRRPASLLAKGQAACWTPKPF